MAEHALPPARYEPQDVGFVHVLAGFFGTLVALLLTVLLVVVLYPSLTVDRRLAGPLPEYPPPRLQSNPTADLRRFIATELAQLNGGGWIDQSKGIAHIPIDMAMRRIVEQGIPDWPAQKGKAP